MKKYIDLLMGLSLLFLSGYHLHSEVDHEIIGVCFMTLYIVHNLLNRTWYQHLLKGKYTKTRVLFVVIDICLLICMTTQMISGIFISRYIFSFFSIHQGIALARKLHILGTYWSIVFVGLHLGLHSEMILSKQIKVRVPTYLKMFVILYGIYVFFKRDFLIYLFLKSDFVFLNYDEPMVLFYFDYIVLVGCFMASIHFGKKVIR